MSAPDPEPQILTNQPDAEVKPPPPPPPSQPGSESPEPEAAEGDHEEEEEGECGFCLFMKAGGCRDVFVDWENCVEEADKNNEDLVEKCAKVTAALKQCMDSHSDYYEPILKAEKDAEKQALDELEKEKEAQSQQNAPKDGDSTSKSNDEK